MRIIYIMDTYKEIEYLKDDLAFYRSMYDSHTTRIKRLEKELNILFLHKIFT